MSAFMQLVVVLIIIVAAAKTAGYLSTRINQPSVFGELLVGLLLGPSLINLVHLPFITNTHLEETVIELGEIGVLLLMFLAGLELHISDLARNTRVAALAGVLGVLLPVGLGYLAGTGFGQEPPHALFLGLALGATSVSISAQTLMELGKLRSKVGLGLLGSAVFDDIIVILLLSTVTALLGNNGAGGWQVLFIIFRMVVFMVLALAFGTLLLPHFVRAVSRLSISQGLVTLALVVMLVYSLAAEQVGGMAAITGAFIAGLMLSRAPEKERIQAGMSSIAYAFFVPIFFVAIGLQVNIRELQPAYYWFILVISLLAILGKIIGSGSGGKLGGFSWVESLQLGIGMVSRGEVGLIVASVGLSAGMLDQNVFSAVIGMVLLTTLVTPPLLRASFSKALVKENQSATHKTSKIEDKEMS